MFGCLSLLHLNGFICRFVLEIDKDGVISVHFCEMHVLINLFWDRVQILLVQKKLDEEFEAQDFDQEAAACELLDVVEVILSSLDHLRLLLRIVDLFPWVLDDDFAICDNQTLISFSRGLVY